MRQRSKPATAKSIKLALLALAVPLLALAVRHASQYDGKPVYELMFSADGRELRLFRGDFGSTPPDAHEVHVWDLASGELRRTSVAGRDQLSVSRDGAYLGELGTGGRIRVIDSVTLTTVEESRVPESRGKLLWADARGPFVIVTSFEDQKKLHVMCLSHGRIIRHWPDAADGFLTRNGRRFFLCRYEADTGKPTTEVFDVQGDSFSSRPDLSFAGRVIAADSGGDVAFLVDGASFVVRNVPEKVINNWAPPGLWGQPWIISVSPHGDLVHSIHDSGVSATFDAKSGAFTRTERLEHLSEALYVWSVSPDERLIAATNGYQPVRIWDLATGRLVARLPDHRPIRYGLGAAYLAWCLIWIASGLRSAPPRPWLDVLAINGGLLAVLMVHAATRPVWEIHPAVIAVCLGMLTGLMGMLIVWWIHGKVRWSLRLAGMIAGTAAIAAGVLGSGHRADPGVWNIILGTLSFVGLLAVLLKWQRWRRLTVARRGAEPAASLPADGGRWQAPLRDLLTLTAAVALLLAVMRFSVPGVREPVVLAYVSVLGAGLAVTVFLSIWAALSNRRIWPVLPVILSAAIGGSLPTLLFGSMGFDPLWWCVTLHGVAAGTVLLSLGVFRLHDYRLAKADLHHGAKAPLLSASP